MRSDPRGASAAVDEVCPRCGAHRDPGQEFCLECGLPLPVAQGRLPGLRRRWLERIGWYPGDWVWVSLLTFVVAAAGAAVAIAATTGGGSGGAATIVAPPPVPQPVTTAPAPPATTATVTNTTTPTTAPAPPKTVSTPGPISWPAGKDGWTLVLISYPVSGGPAVPREAAERAARDGLQQVGVLRSDDYSSLHPGYLVVFSGVYDTVAEAEAALATARAGGFAGAYTRQIAQ